MAQTKKPRTKKIAHAPKVVKTKDGARLKKLNHKQAKKVLKSEQRQKALVPSWKIMKTALTHLWKHKKLFFGISVVYGIFYLLLVKGFASNFQLDTLRANLEENTGSVVSGLGGGLTLYGLLIGSASTTTTEVAGVYQLFLFIIGSLAIIRALRLTYAEKLPTVKESFYTSTEQFVPFLIVLFFLMIQLLPALVGTSIYNTVVENGIVNNSVQQFAAAVFMVAGIMLSLYYLSSAVLAVYIVTLRGTAPREAMRTARSLVRYRRKKIIMKMLFFPVFLLVLSCIALVPLIMFIPVAAELVFLVASIFVLAVAHSYYYAFYRSLI